MPWATRGERDETPRIISLHTKVIMLYVHQHILEIFDLNTQFRNNL